MFSTSHRVAVTTNPITNDVVVESSGVVEYTINMYTTVKCAINLFTYPVVNDFCPVALNGWTNKEGMFGHHFFHISLL